MGNTALYNRWTEKEKNRRHVNYIYSQQEDIVTDLAIPITILNSNSRPCKSNAINSHGNCSSNNSLKLWRSCLTNVVS